MLELFEQLGVIGWSVIAVVVLFMIMAGNIYVRTDEHMFAFGQ